MNITYRPISQWPGVPLRPSQRLRSPFSANWTATKNLLDRELTFLRATNVVFQIALREQDFRLDGQPRATAKAEHPGVILSLESKHGPLSYPCDKFSDFQANVRAIALSLEALRKVDRYGVTKRGEQYTGWKAIGSGIAMSAPVMSFEDAARVVAEAAGDPNWALEILSDPAFAREGLYRSAVKALHPDNGGDVKEFQRLQEAMSIIDKVRS